MLIHHVCNLHNRAIFCHLWFFCESLVFPISVFSSFLLSFLFLACYIVFMGKKTSSETWNMKECYSLKGLVRLYWPILTTTCDLKVNVQHFYSWSERISWCRRSLRQCSWAAGIFVHVITTTPETSPDQSRVCTPLLLNMTGTDCTGWIIVDTATAIDDKEESSPCPPGSHLPEQWLSQTM